MLVDGDPVFNHCSPANHQASGVGQSDGAELGTTGDIASPDAGKPETNKTAHDDSPRLPKRFNLRSQAMKSDDMRARIKQSGGQMTDTGHEAMLVGRAVTANGWPITAGRSEVALALINWEPIEDTADRIARVIYGARRGTVVGSSFELHHSPKGALQPPAARIP